MNKKIIRLLAGTLFTTCFATAAFTAELSQDTVNKCVAYLNSPDTVAPDAAALEQCYQNNVCGNNPAFSDVNGCTKNLMLWHFKTNAPKPTQTKTSIATPTDIQSATDTAKKPASQTVAPTQETSETQNTPEKTAPNQNQGKPQKPSINWF